MGRTKKVIWEPEFIEFMDELDKLEMTELDINLISFDIEIYNELDFDSNGNTDYEKVIPSIAAFTVDGESVEFFYDEPYMTKETARGLIETLRDWTRKGYYPIAWNGVGFDFRVMGLYSGMVDECAELAIVSFDPMLSVLDRKGYPIKLDAALVGAGLGAKTKVVALNSGEIMFDMSGELAPKMWREKEIDAVKEYLKGDVIQPYWLGKDILKRGKISWQSKAGKNQSCTTPLEQVFTIMGRPEPAPPSWWTQGTPPTRTEFVGWIPESIVEKYVSREE